MKPSNLKTKIFLDSGDPNDTKQALQMLGFLDGQTTNPSLVAKKLKAQNPDIKLTNEELLENYKNIVQEISTLLPDGSVSIEVYADKNTEAKEMFAQGSEMFTWIPNAHIKYPTINAGLKAAEMSIEQGMKVNMTLVFTQQQAAAVYAATLGATKGDVFLSPFIGRLDDKGINGMSLISNTKKMYKSVAAGDENLDSAGSHVEILAASVRSYAHFKACIALGADIITAPMKFLKEWADQGMPVDMEYHYDTGEMQDIDYVELNLSENWESFDINHELTDIGLEKFASDWNSLIG